MILEQTSPQNECFDLFVRGVPKPQGRPRIVRFRNGKAGLKDPETSRDWKNYIRLAVAEAWQGRPWHEGVELELEFYLPIPKSWSKKKQLAALDGRLRPTGRPDVDNLAKAVVDALMGIALEDDSQVVSLFTGKYYSTLPGVKIRIRRIA